jgi:prolyl-tRNA synthetase
MSAMRQTELFTKTRKSAPKDEVAKNAELLIRAGYIHKEMAGVYAYLPLGLRVLQKIEEIIREEINAIGGQELLMTTLQDSLPWQKTGRWDDEVLDVWFKTHLQNKTEIGLATTHEEPLTNLLREYVDSYRDLPFSVYQFQTKFRNELRAKSGIMRGREFIMKDLYSFSRNQAEHDKFYEKARGAYERIFTRVGLGEKTYFTYASGGSFSKFSHEFQTLTDAGEDIIYLDQKTKTAVNKEVYTPETVSAAGLEMKSLEEAKSVEIGNIFSLGTRFSEALGLTFKDENGIEQPVIMGSYGIGLGRVMGTVVEVLSDEKGIVWPESIAPFKVHLVRVGDNEEVIKATDKIYQDLLDRGVEVLYDDRATRPGEKFADADLVGLPYRLVVSDKTLAAGKWELKRRTESESKLATTEELLSILA